MKKTLLLTFILMPGLGWSMTNEQATEAWKADCTLSGGEHKVDFIKTGGAERQPNLIHICEFESGAQSIRLVPLVQASATPEG